jgi:ketosteroid isomerase-like protein
MLELASGPLRAQAEAPMSETLEKTAAAQNEALIRSGYDAFARGDVPTVLALFDPNILWHVPGRGPLSRDYRGPEDVLSFFQHFMTLSNGTFRIRVDDMLADDDKVVVLCTESAERGAKSWSSPQVHVWTLEDGRATTFWQYQGDQQTEDEFWASAP